MLSSAFAHDVSSTVNQPSQFIKWDFNSYDNDVSFYIDADITKGFNDPKNKRKFLWLLESPFFNGNAFDIIINNLDKVLDTYELIFTYSLDLLDVHPKFKWVPANGSWIKYPKIYDKSKLASMIASAKTITPFHQYRYRFAVKHMNSIDVFGRGFNPIETKEEGLRDYMFSVCIENCDHGGYFTEKVNDCFACGTIPIYKGSRKLSQFYDVEGIIFLDDINSVDLTPELYYSKMSHIENNFNKYAEYKSPEDYMYLNHLKDIL